MRIGLFIPICVACFIPALAAADANMTPPYLYHVSAPSSIDTLFRISIDTVQALTQATVKIRSRRVSEMGSYNFLICFDTAVLRFSSVRVDTALAQWEYFTYRTGSVTGCVPCGSGGIRLIGIADMNNGSAHPPDGAYLPLGPLHAITFSVASDRPLAKPCGFVQFCSYTCYDNTIGSRLGDTLYHALSGVADSCFGGYKEIDVAGIVLGDGVVCIGQSIPTLSEWGEIIFGTLLLTGVILYRLGKRRQSTQEV